MSTRRLKPLTHPSARPKPQRLPFPWWTAAATVFVTFCGYLAGLAN